MKRRSSVLLLCVSMMATAWVARAQSAQKSSAQSTAPTAEPPADFTLPVDTYAGAVYPSMKPAIQVMVYLNGKGTDFKLIAEIKTNEQKGWDCTKPSSYLVAVQGTTKQLPIAAVLPIGQGSCKDPIPDPVLLRVTAAIDPNASYEVSLAGLPDGKVVRSAPIKFTSTTKSSFSMTPQSVPGEAMNNGATRDVGQMDFAYSVPFIGQSPVLFNTKDVLSTDSEDAKSSWAATIGVSHGLFSAWYAPMQFTETVQGNQVASNVSAVTNFSVSGLVPWYWSRKVLNNSAIDAGLAPEFGLGAAYTRRIEQLVTAKTPKLADNDASVNPSLTIEPFYLLPAWCARYQKWIGVQSNSSTSRQFCLALQADLGLYYLPTDKTSAGNEKVDGYGDVSLLIPLSNLNFSSFQIVKADGLLNSEIDIEWSDSVNAANNYARTRQWTFGVQVMK